MMQDRTPSERADNKHQLPVRRHSGHSNHSLDPRPLRSRSSAQQSSGDGLSPAVLLRVFQQWWKWVLPAGLIMAAVAGAIVMKMHVLEYEATAMIMIEASEPYIAFSNITGQRGGSRFIATQVELIRSSIVLEPVMALPAVAELDEFRASVEPVDQLKKNLNIKQVGKSELYLISYKSRDPESAAIVANAVVEEYMKNQSSEEFRQAQRVIDLLEEERRKRSQEIEQLRNQVVSMAQELTGTDPFGHGAITDYGKAYSPTASIYHKSIGNDVQIGLLKAEIQSLQETPLLYPEESDDSALLELEVESSETVRIAKAKIKDLEKRAEYFKKKYINWETNSDYLELVKDTEEASEKFDEAVADTKARILELRKADKEKKHASDISAKQKQLAKLELLTKLWDKQFKEAISELKAGGAQSVQLEFAKAELARKERVFELIAARKLALQTELRAPQRVTDKQVAAIPKTPLELIPIKLLLIACTSSMVLPFGLVLLKELMAKKIIGSDQLHQVTHLPILGEISHFPVRPVAEGPRALPRRQQREMFIFAESIDSLRTNLVLTENLGAEGKSNVIAVASAASGEGKTSVATSLAVSISGATKRPTLVVDADLRSPDVAHVLGVANEPGLYEVLAGKQSLGDAIVRIGETNTYVLPAGRIKGNPHHMIDGSKIALLFENLRGKFATIVVDTPPVLGASEALVYASEADLVVFCSLADVSRTKQVTTAVGRLQSTGADIAGAVLSGIAAKQYAYAYGYYGDQEL